MVEIENEEICTNLLGELAPEVARQAAAGGEPLEPHISRKEHRGQLPGLQGDRGNKTDGVGQITTNPSSFNSRRKLHGHLSGLLSSFLGRFGLLGLLAGEQLHTGKPVGGDSLASLRNILRGESIVVSFLGKEGVQLEIKAEIESHLLHGASKG